MVSQFPGMFGTVQALEFINSGKQFVSSADVIRRNSVDKAVIVWDFDTVNICCASNILRALYYRTKCIWKPTVVPVLRHTRQQKPLWRNQVEII